MGSVSEKRPRSGPLQEGVTASCRRNTTTLSLSPGSDKSAYMQPLSSVPYDKWSRLSIRSLAIQAAAGVLFCTLHKDRGGADNCRATDDRPLWRPSVLLLFVIVTGQIAAAASGI